MEERGQNGNCGFNCQNKEKRVQKIRTYDRIKDDIKDRDRKEQWL